VPLSRSHGRYDRVYNSTSGSLPRDGLGLKVVAATIAATFGAFVLSILSFRTELTKFVSSRSIANPCDLVKVRMQRYYPEGSPYHNTLSAFAAVWREGAYRTIAPSPSTTTSYTHSPAFARTLHTTSAQPTVPAAHVRGGIESLYRGIGATTIRGIILSTSQICAYDQAKQTLKRRGAFEEGLGLHLTSSLFAGLFCSITSNPVGEGINSCHSD
jgi:hypothetical protein